jgi:hypothetical protein
MLNIRENIMCCGGKCGGKCGSKCTCDGKKPPVNTNEK